MKQPSLFDAPVEPPPVPDQAARDFAVNPAHDVVLEASAGTGKTRVLVGRYVRLIEAGVDPAHILAITFTRKAAAEMRERVLAELRQRAAAGAIRPSDWRALRDRITDIQISTIDAFCFGLLREFPLEADVEPGFEIADETEMARFANEAMDLTLRAARGFLASDEPLRLLFARVKGPVLSDAIGSLLDRRHVALPAVGTFVARRGGVASSADAARAFVERVRDLLAGSPHRSALLDDGPAASTEFRWLHADLTNLDALASADPGRVQQFRRRIERGFLTKAGDARKKTPFPAAMFASVPARRRHEEALKALAPDMLDAMDRLDADVNALLARGVLRLLAIAVEKYERLLDEHGVLDFAGMLAKSVALLERQEEFARSRLKLQSRYHHLLVDEFQDTSRLQWRLVELLVDAWGEGEGAADAPTSVFVVGDRKQSIYRFRHAEVTLLDQAARKIAALRPGRPVRQVISTSFRAVPELLAFVNALSESIQSTAPIDERFTYSEGDRFPVPEVAPGGLRDGEPVVGLAAESSIAQCASAVAAEVERLIGHADVRDRTGVRKARPEDVAILFRARLGHQYFEDALESRGIRTYVYKGLGFFDAPEVQDLQALLRYLAQPDSDLRAAELLRSRLVRLSDVGLVRLAPSFAAALSPDDAPAAGDLLDETDRALLDRIRAGLSRWLPLADRLTPSELVDTILRESAYVYEMRGRRLGQARENVKKVRALVRKVENRGYATLDRLARYFETLRAGEESNAIVEAAGCVNLMTIHAAKGLEFPVVFIVNLHMPGRGRPPGFSVIERGAGGEPEVAFSKSDSTRLEELREEEELRRLFYVAVTRARDRLYLATEIDRKGKPRRPARSLAGLLPGSLMTTIAMTAADPAADLADWDTPRGRFSFRVCRPAESVPAPATLEPCADEIDIGALASGTRRVSAATSDAVQAGRPLEGASTTRAWTGPHERLAGTLVHRLFQRRLPPDMSEVQVRAFIPHLLAPEDLVDVADPGLFAGDVAALYVRWRRRADVQATLGAGECHYEVPFSFIPPDRPGVVVRGLVDCLVVGDDGTMTVVEFKTGVPRPEHETQARLYAEALRTAFSADRVEIKILYP